MMSHPIPSWTKRKNWLDRINNYPWTVETIIRDGYKCVDCNIGSKMLVVHHIDESRKNGKLNNSLTNLVTLCKHCHAIRHGHNGKEGSSYIEDKIIGYTMLTKGMIPQGMLQTIAKELGLSRERVRQVAKRMGLIMPRKTVVIQNTGKCASCGKEFDNRNHKKCCSPECYKQYRLDTFWTTIDCKNCGKKIKFRKNLIALGRPPVFCSKFCQGKFMGKEYGWKKGRKLNYYPKAYTRIKDMGKQEFSLREYTETFNMSRVNAYSDMWTLIQKNIVSKKVGTGRKGSPIKYIVNKENLTKLENNATVNL